MDRRWPLWRSREQMSGSQVDMLQCAFFDALDLSETSSTRILEGRGSSPAGALADGSPLSSTSDAQAGGAAPVGANPLFWQPRADKCQDGCDAHARGFPPCRGKCSLLEQHASDKTALLAKIDKALQHVFDLAAGRERWTMRIPARPDEDSDCVLADALSAAKDALAACQSENRSSPTTVWGPEKQDYPGGPIYRVGTSTGATLPDQSLDKLEGQTPRTDARDEGLREREGWDTPAYNSMMFHANKLEKELESLRSATGLTQEQVDFLRGAGPLDGVWFGNRHPTLPGAFWWRSVIWPKEWKYDKERRAIVPADRRKDK